jgi:2-hydroxychromene-2-carboxylate isomerase
VKREPRLFFSFRSPFSWLALVRLRRAMPTALDRVEWIPFWDPDVEMERALESRGARMHYVPMSKAKHFYILEDTKRLADKLGLKMAWPIDTDRWWEVPHLGWLHARRLGRSRAFYEALAEARWSRGENICDPAVLGAIGATVGLDAAVLSEAARDPSLRAEALDCLVEAYNDDIFGIPYFRVRRHRFWGFDRVDDFVETLGRELGLGDAGATPVGGAGQPGFTSSVRPGLEAILAGEAGLPLIGYDADTSGGCG